MRKGSLTSRVFKGKAGVGPGGHGWEQKGWARLGPAISASLSSLAENATRPQAAPAPSLCLCLDSLCPAWPRVPAAAGEGCASAGPPAGQGVNSDSTWVLTCSSVREARGDT